MLAAILEALDEGRLQPGSLKPASFVSRIGEILEGTMGGTIGACESTLYCLKSISILFSLVFAIFFTAWSTALRRDSTSPYGVHSPLKEALVALGKHTPARPGDRTVVDALAPLCESVASPTTTTRNLELEAVMEAVKNGAENTRGMRARLGRASYVTTNDGEVPPDPGAWGLAAVVEGFVRGLQTATS